MWLYDVGVREKESREEGEIGRQDFQLSNLTTYMSIASDKAAKRIKYNMISSIAMNTVSADM